MVKRFVSIRRYDVAGAAAFGRADDALPQWGAVEHSEPARPATVHSDVVVPMAQAAISGAIAAACAGGAAWAFGADAALAGRIGGGVGLAALGVVWASLLADSRRLLWAIESATGRDIDGDGQAGRPGSEPARLVLEVKRDGGERGAGLDFLHLAGVDQGAFVTWARAVIGGASLAQGAWIGRGGLFSRSAYDAMLAELERGGLVRWIDAGNKAQGRELSAAGRAALRRLVDADGAHARTHAHAGDAARAVACASEWGGGGAI